MPTAAHSAIGGDDALNADLLESFRDTVKIQTFSFPFIPLHVRTNRHILMIVMSAGFRARKTALIRPPTQCS
jgi:hypothetical protein